MKHATLFLSLLFCILVISCHRQQQGGCLVIDLVNHKSLPTEQIALSDISESIQIIRLETSDSSLVGSVRSIKSEAGKLFIHASNGVFVFDIYGKFLNTVGSKGRGPKEYVGLYAIYPEDDIVWLLDDSGKKALKYTDSGTFLESFDFEKLRFTDYYYSGSDAFIGFVPDQGQSHTDIMLAFFDATGIIDSVLYKKPIRGDVMQRFLYDEATFAYHGAQIKYKYLFNDTIYHIKDNELHSNMVLHLGEGKANEHARADAANKGLNYDLFQDMDLIRLLGESSRYVYLHTGNAKIFWDKRERKAHKWGFTLPNDKRIDPEEAKKFIPDYIDKYGNLTGVTTSANPENNQVIVIAKLKQ